MSSRIPFWSSLRDLFGGSSSRRRRSRGKRPAQSFLAQFDGGDGTVGRQAPAPFGGFDALEVRVMLAVIPAAESDFGFNALTGTITSYSGGGGDVVIPATIGGVTVTGIGNNAFSGKTALTSLTIPDDVTSIGNFAFYGCTGLTSLSLPTNLKTIGFAAFRGCTGLTSLTIPNSVTSISIRGFENCYSLTSLYFLGNAPTVGSYAFDGVGLWGPVSATIYYLTGTTGWTTPFKGLTAVSVASIASSSGDFGCSISKDAVTITSYTGSGGAVTIPGTIFGLPVTGIGTNAFLNKTALTSLVIPATVTTIGDDAFEECVNLTSITLPAGLTRIGDYAFWNCAKLTSLALPSGLTTIGEQAFYNCAGLTTLAIPASVTSIGSDAFQDCTGLTAFDVAAGNASYKSIDGLLFTKNGATLLQCPQAKTGSVSLPAGLTTIGAAALANCAGLTGVTIPTGVTTIGAGAFYGCYGLTSLAIPASVTSIGTMAFTACNALTALTVEAGNPAYKTVGSLLLTANGQTVVACAGGTTGAIAIPAGVTTIGDYAFKGCGGLTGVTIPAGVTTISAGAFSNCSGLTSLVIPATVTFLGPNAFERCSGLTSLVFLGNAPGGGAFPFDRVTATISYLTGTTGWTNPFNGLTTVGVAAVDYRSGDFAYSISKDAVTITEYTGAGGAVTFPATILGLPVTAIGNEPFDFMPTGLDRVTSVAIPATVTSIGEFAFDACSGLTSLTIPAAVTSIGMGALARCSGLTAFTVEPGNTSFKTVGSLLLTADGKTLVACAGGASGAVEIPAGVTTIIGRAFQGCSRLTSLTIPVGVTSIGDFWTFGDCSGLTSLALPAGVTSIGGAAFFGCTGLTSLSLPTNLTSIGNYAFVACSGLTSLAIPAGVTSIGNFAFGNCTGLTSLALPAAVASIGDAAFSGCIKLATITVEAGNTSYKTVGSLLLTADGTTVVVCPGGVKGAIVIPAGVTTIGNYAFNNCFGLTSLAIPAGVTTIGNSAFAYSSGLTSLYFAGDAPATVGLWSFAGMPATLYYLTGTTGWTNPFFDAPTVAVDFKTGDFRWSIASGAVTITAYTGSAAAVTIPDTIFGLPVTGIGNSAFAGNTGLTSLVIHAGITSIGASAFADCTGLASLYFLGDAPATVGSDAFSNVSGMIYYFRGAAGWTDYIDNGTATEITSYEADGFAWTIDGAAIAVTGYTGADGAVAIPATLFGRPVTGAGDNAFNGRNGLTAITIPATVTSIGTSAFEGCTGLTSLPLPSGVTKIGAYAFAGCTGLTSLAIPSGVTSIGGRAFQGCTGLTTLAIPSGVTTISAGLFQYCTGLTSLSIPAGVTSIGNSAFNGCSGLTSLFIPSGVKTIGNGAFTKCTGLTSLTIPAGVTTIASQVFQGCRGLTSLTLPAGANRINPQAFEGCSGLTSLFIPSGVTTISTYAFAGCTGLSSLTIPSGVTTIDSSVFLNCTGLTSLVIPVGVTSIGANAFKGCTGLTSLSFLGNAPATVGGDAFSGVTATIYYLPATTGWSSPFNGLTAIAINAAPTAVSLSPASASVAENTSTATRLKMADVVVTDDGAGTNATTLSGADAARFEVDAGVLYLKAGTILNFETKTSYSVTVSVADASVVGSVPVTATFTLTVTDVNESPVFTSGGTGSVAENAATSTVIYTAVATDSDGTAPNKTISYSIKPAVGDAALVSIDAATGQVRLLAAANFETKASYTVTVVATDGGSPALAAEQAVTIAVTDVNESPVFTSGGTGSVAENAATSTVIYTAVATDPDGTAPNKTISYSIKPAVGDATLVSIDAATGQVRLLAAANFETKASYTVTVVATDGGSPALAAEQPVTVAVTNVPPAVVSVVSLPRSHKAGDTIVVTVTFSEPVVVTGVPQIGLTVGSTLRQAVYTGGSGTATLQFGYVVAAGENDADGVAVAQSIALPGSAAIRDEGLADAATTLPFASTSGAVVDTIQPILQGVTGPAARTYASGEKLSFTVTFNEPMAVTGLPYLDLKVNNVTRRAVYDSGAATNKLVFSYSIAVGEFAAAGKVVASGKSIQLPAGAAVTDRAGNPPVTLAYTPPATTGVKVDGIVPVAASVTPPAVKTYRAGQTLDFKVNYSRAVFVNGVPQLTVAIGQAFRQADSIGGSGTKSLSFRYVVAAGDLGVQGVVLGNRVSLNSGSIRDAVGNPAQLTLPAVNTRNVLVDAVPPSVTGLTIPAAATYKKGQTLSFTVTFSEAVVVTGVPRLQAVIGTTVRSMSYVRGTGTSSLVFSYTLQATDHDADGIALESQIVLGTGAIRDGGGNPTILTLPGIGTSGVKVS